MRTLCVFLNDKPVGTLSEGEDLWSFAYNAQWAQAPDSFDLAPGLPRAERVHQDGGTSRPVQWYFDNLLPEETLRETVTKEAGIKGDDAFALLEYLGAESAGSLVLLPPGEKAPARDGLQALSDAQLSQRIRNLPRASLGSGAPKRMSVAGAQHKLLVVYRGKHCPICKSYLGTLDKLLDQFREIGTEVFAVSADTKEKAENEATEQAWRFPVGYGLSQEQMRSLGLYISEPRSPQETDRPFPEPGLFVINPQGQVQIVDISNAPFARPDLSSVLNGIKFVKEKHYPIRGTLA